MIQCHFDASITNDSNSRVEALSAWQISKNTAGTPSSLLNILKEHRNKQDEARQIMEEAYNDNDLVACYDDEHPIHPGTFNKAFRDILIRYKLPLIRFHDLRHTNATLMLKYNVPAKVASERRGHSAIGITLDLYSHVMKEMQQDAAFKLDNAIFKRNCDKLT